MNAVNLDQLEVDWPDEDERSTVARRLFTYSARALSVAASADRVMVSHPSFKQVLEGCDRVFQLSRELSMQQGLVVSGPTGSGKTALIRYFRMSLPRSELFEDGHGAVAVRLIKRPTVGHLIGGLLRQIRYPFPQVSAQTLAVKRNVLVDALKQKGTRLLFVDEAHNLVTQARMRSRVEDGSSVTDFLRELMDEVPLGLALFGSPDLQDLNGIDHHLGSRTSAQFALKAFEDDGLWLRFVQAFTRQCKSFDLSLLGEKEHASRLHKATNGNLRAFKRLVTEAVLVGADSQAQALVADHLKVAFDRVNGKEGGLGNPYVSAAA